jgi:hypothetical protein
MITVLRRWFVPSEKLAEFQDKWRSEVMPDIIHQPGCVQVEMYESSIRDHWVSAVTWEDEESRSKALEPLSKHQREFAEYERFEPEILFMRTHVWKLGN